MWRTDNRDMSFTIDAFSALVRRDLSSSLFASLVLPPVPWQTPPDDSLHPLTILCSVQVQKLLLYTAGWLILPLPIKNIAHRLYMFLPLNQWKLDQEYTFQENWLKNVSRYMRITLCTVILPWKSWTCWLTVNCKLPSHINDSSTLRRGWEE